MIWRPRHGSPRDVASPNRWPPPRFRGRGKRRASLRRHGGALSPSFSTTNPSASPQGAKRPNEARTRAASTRTHFALDKENPIQGRVRGLGDWPHPLESPESYGFGSPASHPAPHPASPRRAGRGEDP